MAEKFPELIEAGLNKSQRRFCKIGDNKNIRLLAPAGSGKTFSLLWRCKCIHEEYIAAGKPAPNFLIITFTRTARFELEDRIGNNENFNSLKMTVSTLNAWGWEFMKNRSGKELITGKFNRRGLITHPYTKSAIEGTIAAFDDTVQKIMKKDYSKCAKDIKVCKNCDFRFYCQNQ